MILKVNKFFPGTESVDMCFDNGGDWMWWCVCVMGCEERKAMWVGGLLEQMWRSINNNINRSTVLYYYYNYNTVRAVVIYWEPCVVSPE